MKKRLLSLLLFVVVGLSAVQAYDFSVVVPSGQTLYFTITSNSAPYTVEIILPQSKSSYIGYKKLTGNLVIPSTVTYQERTYNVTSIGDYAFNFCYGLTSVSIPNSVTAIGKYAFAYCICLASVSIPNSVAAIGRGAFSWVKNIIYNGSAIGSPWGALSHNGFVENGFVYNDSTKTTLQRYIGTDTNVIIPNSVTAIESNTFIDCHNLTSVTIPYGVTSIRDYAFAYCYGLTSITIPNGIIAIESNAFRDCFNLTSVIIPNSVATIGDDAFEYCSSLTTLNFNAINCDNFSSRGYPFFNCPISTINIGDSVQQIPNNLIKHNTHLTTLTLGSNLTSIPANTFSACSSLQSVTCFSKTPPGIDSSVFPYPNTALLSVPHGSIESYSSPTSYWNMFFNGRISEN